MIVDFLGWQELWILWRKSEKCLHLRDFYDKIIKERRGLKRSEVVDARYKAKVKGGEVK
jgi:hypothetical protein